MIGTKVFCISMATLVAALVLNPAPVWSSPETRGFWMFTGAPLGDADVQEIVVDPEDDALRYVTSSSNGLYLTRDSGDSWEQHLEGNVGAIAMDPNNPATVYVSSGSDLYVTFNRGEFWDLLVPFPATIPGDPTDSPTFIDSILVSSTEGTIVVGLTSMLHSARVYVSEDGGGLWTVSFQSPTGYHIWDLAEIPDNGFWFFCTEDSAHQDNPVVMRSVDRGDSWEEMLPLTGVPTSGHGLNLAVHPATEIVYFLSEASVLYTSVDFGNSWSAGDYVGFGSTLMLDRNCLNRIFGGEMVRGMSMGGVFISENGGQSFVFEGPANNTISSLALNSTSDMLFAAAPGAGLWELDLGETLSCTQEVLLFADGFERGDHSRWISGS